MSSSFKPSLLIASKNSHQDLNNTKANTLQANPNPNMDRDTTATTVGCTAATHQVEAL